MEDARLIDIEIRLTHQEATVQALNDEVAAQQRLIDQLHIEVKALQRQLRDMTPTHIAEPWDETPPPHY